MTKILVTGAGGFIGGHLVSSLISEGNSVRAIDMKPLSHWHQLNDHAENIVADLSGLEKCLSATQDIEHVYNLAADMGGMGFIETHKADCMLSVLINTNLLRASRDNTISKYFYSSSACVYSAEKQTDERVTALKESDAYPAQPEDGYGWEKLFSERMCRHFLEDFGLETRVARYHNVYGPFGTFYGGREKAPAAICRKVAFAKKTKSKSIEIWGDGEQTRSFMYIDDCVYGSKMLVKSLFTEPLNIGSSELVSINQMVELVESIAGVKLEKIYNLNAPQGVRGRNSDNSLIKKEFGWEPSISLSEGLERTYKWIYDNLDEYQKSLV